MAVAVDRKLVERAVKFAALEARGKIFGISGPVVRARGVKAAIGQQFELCSEDGCLFIPAEVIGTEGADVILMALENPRGIGTGCEVSLKERSTTVAVGEELLGRVIDGLGRPIDGGPLFKTSERRLLRGKAPNPMERNRIIEPICTGLKIVDSMLTVGRGQRIGVFAGAGVGKTTLLSMTARFHKEDVCVIGLIGERGREVREFVEDAVTAENRKHTVVVAVTGDEAPLTRVQGALLATTIAEYFRSKGKNVLLMIDSLTRYAMALREVGLAGGELPTSKGYPPSVFMELARLLERAGNDSSGSITGVYSVLVEGDDMADPVADSSRSLLDGHLILSRELANRGLHPAIDVLSSASRLMNQVTEEQHLLAARKVLSTLATYKQVEDLIRIGAYKPGSDPAVDRARAFVPRFEQFMKQSGDNASSFTETAKALLDLSKHA